MLTRFQVLDSQVYNLGIVQGKFNHIACSAPPADVEKEEESTEKPRLLLIKPACPKLQGLCSEARVGLLTLLSSRALD